MLCGKELGLADREAAMQTLAEDINFFSGGMSDEAKVGYVGEGLLEKLKELIEISKTEMKGNSRIPLALYNPVYGLKFGDWC